LDKEGYQSLRKNHQATEAAANLVNAALDGDRPANASQTFKTPFILLKAGPMLGLCSVHFTYPFYCPRFRTR
jgi:hypothetical protein